MSPAFDLLERGWVPVRVAGELRQVGLRELFLRAHEIEDVLLPVAPAAAGLWRVLYAISARVSELDQLGESGDEWTARRDELAELGRFDPDAVNGYFGKYENRWDLFDAKRPWMQDPRLAAECGKAAGVNKLVLGRPAGNNQVWFGHFTDLEPTPIPTAEAAWYLLACLYYGPSGMCSSRKVKGQAFSNSTAGPLRSVVSFHPTGRNVFESLLAGLLPPELADETSTAPDLCPWEMTELPDPLGVPTPRTWPGGMLTAQARHAVLLVPSDDGEQVVDAYLTWAWRQVKAPVRDPYVIWKQSKQGTWYAQRADSTKALWRDLDSLLHHQNAERTVDRPQVIDACMEVPFTETLRLRAFGFDQDGQTRDIQWYTATTPPILQWLEEKNPETAYGIATTREAAETIAGRLRDAMREAWREVSTPLGSTGRMERVPEGPWLKQAMARYWPEAEKEFWRRVDSRDFQVPLNQFKKIAHKIVDDVTNQHTWSPRVVKAVSRAHAIVSRGRTKERKSA